MVSEWHLDFTGLNKWSLVIWFGVGGFIPFKNFCLYK